MDTVVSPFFNIHLFLPHTLNDKPGNQQVHLYPQALSLSAPSSSPQLHLQALSSIFKPSAPSSNSSSIMFRQYQGYTRIEEDEVPSTGTTSASGSPVTAIPRPTEPRNVAYVCPTVSASNPTSRAQVLDRLMPLSKNPWTTIPTILDNSIRDRPKNSATSIASLSSSSSSSSASSLSSSSSSPVVSPRTSSTTNRQS
ncbi:hypothetical protein EDD11_009608 [Mortierella claussenii]|nr:hypothetical protein EDD11_009608 [Mortierella claussenii]